MIPHRTTLRVEVPIHLGDVLPLFLVLIYRVECELTLATLRPLLRHFVRLAILNTPPK
jgi:hypothetical protein